MPHGIIDDYDIYLKPFLEIYIQHLYWVASLPKWKRFFLRKHLRSHKSEFSGTNFVCRNPFHPLVLEFKMVYKKATFIDYHILNFI